MKFHPYKKESKMTLTTLLHSIAACVDFTNSNNYDSCIMTEKISTVEIRQRLGDILNRVALRNDQFIIERKGKALAAMVPVERLEQMQQAARLHLLRVLGRESGQLTEAEADRIADEAKHRTRKRARR